MLPALGNNDSVRNMAKVVCVEDGRSGSGSDSGNPPSEYAVDGGGPIGAEGGDALEVDTAVVCNSPYPRTYGSAIIAEHPPLFKPKDCTQWRVRLWIFQ